MSVETDEGFASLQRGDTEAAIAQLERACAGNPSDYLAQLYLGAAYGQANRQTDAVTALTRAVLLEPTHAKARYNLAIAYECAGYPEQALAAAQQAILLQPDYPKALEMAARLQQALTPATDLQEFNITAGQPTQYAPPTDVSAQAPVHVAQIVGRSPHLPTQTTFTSSAPAEERSYQGLGAAHYGGPPVYRLPHPVVGAGTHVEDRFSVDQAFRDWGRVLISPQAFFRDQTGRTGMKSLMALLIAYTLTVSILCIPIMLMQPHNAVPGYFVRLWLLPPTTLLEFLFGWWIYSLCVRASTRMFGGTSGRSSSFRTIAYAAAPYPFLIIGSAIIGIWTPPQSNFTDVSTNHAIAVQFHPGSERPSIHTTRQLGTPTASTTRVQPAQYHQSNGSGIDTSALMSNMIGGLSAIVLFLVVFVWSTALLAIGVSESQQIPIGAGVGVAVVSDIIIGFVLLLLIAGVFAAITAVHS